MFRKIKEIFKKNKFKKNTSVAGTTDVPKFFDKNFVKGSLHSEQSK